LSASALPVCWPMSWAKDAPGELMAPMAGRPAAQPPGGPAGGAGARAGTPPTLADAVPHPTAKPPAPITSAIAAATTYLARRPRPPGLNGG
jgi:hypothetical protein